jgi:hypothetical protein
MKINIPKEWFENKSNLEEGEIGAGNPNFMKEYDYSQTLIEFNKRYKYCFELLEEYYKSAETYDIKSNFYYYKQWHELAYNIDKIIQQLSLCANDARHIADNFKEK